MNNSLLVCKVRALRQIEIGKRLQLPQVTLCAAASVNIKATISAIKLCTEQIEFSSAKFFTHSFVSENSEDIEIVKIPRLNSSEEYSKFILNELPNHVDTSHCLIVQWDGHVLNCEKWEPQFLHYDYIGASWPQFSDGHDVGNGGFSLRSRRLMRACQAAAFDDDHAEDIAIGRINRNWLESRGMRFAPKEIADEFATERAGNLMSSFGFHGVFNMIEALGTDEFWGVYSTLDNCDITGRDFMRIFFTLLKKRGNAMRGIEMLKDRLFQ